MTASGKHSTTVYKIRDAAGRLAAEHHRIDNPDGTKRMWWQKDGETGLNGTPLADLPFHGAELVSDLGEDELIVVVEDEKAGEAVEAAGLPAVGTVTGASGTPGPEALEVLRDRRVALCPDNDEPGQAHMRRIGEALQGVAAEVIWFAWQDAPEKGADLDLLSELVPVLEQSKVELEAHYEKYPDDEQTDEEMEEFVEIVHDLTESEGRRSPQKPPQASARGKKLRADLYEDSGLVFAGEGGGLITPRISATDLSPGCSSGPSSPTSASPSTTCATPARLSSSRGTYTRSSFRNYSGTPTYPSHSTPTATCCRAWAERPPQRLEKH